VLQLPRTPRTAAGRGRRRVPLPSTTPQRGLPGEHERRGSSGVGLRRQDELHPRSPIAASSRSLSSYGAARVRREAPLGLLLRTRRWAAQTNDGTHEVAVLIESPMAAGGATSAVRIAVFVN